MLVSQQDVHLIDDHRVAVLQVDGAGLHMGQHPPGSSHDQVQPPLEGLLLGSPFAIPCRIAS